MGQGRSALVINKDKIETVGFCSEIPENAEIFDYGDAYVVPGFVDIHIHGGNGFDFVDMTKESFDGIRDFHLSKGTTTICPTLTSCDISKTFDFIEYYKNFEDKTCFGGIHLEGPYLSPKMCGAQNLSYLINPTKEQIEKLISFSDYICKITLAPEKEGCDRLITALADKNVVLSAGHSNATKKELIRASELGVSQITHMYCATPKRYKEGSFVIGGFEETALVNDSFALELIADGHHVCRECFEMAVRCKGIDKVIAISDAMRGAGLDNADESFLGEIKPENRVIIEDGVAKLPDRSSFAGSVTTGEKMFDVLHNKYGYSVADTSKMMSENPANLVNLKNIGKLEKGYFADITVIDKKKVIATFKNGDVKILRTAKANY